MQESIKTEVSVQLQPKLKSNYARALLMVEHLSAMYAMMNVKNEKEITSLSE